jgi:3-oxoacyl-[acyl-carrier protein] reductase
MKQLDVGGGILCDFVVTLIFIAAVSAVCDPEIPAEKVVSGTVQKFGQLDVLINNAGDLIKRVNTSEYTDDYVDALLDLNVRQVVRFVREATVQMRQQQGGGKIINVSSIGARLGGAKGSVLYAATKGFISVATRGWAKELVEHRIRVKPFRLA